MSGPRPHSIGDHGEDVQGPPWILGHRGSPLEAPENTLASLRRALEWGLDGFEYDLRRCRSGELVLLHDATLARTTDGRGNLCEKNLPELFHIDAGGWFGKEFVGEPLPLLEEALELDGDPGRGSPQHMIELKEQGLVSEVKRMLDELPRPLSARVGSFDREVVLAARDAGLSSMLIASEATVSDFEFVRRERIAAYCVGPDGWRTAEKGRSWPCERWAYSVDEPEDLLRACRMPLNAFNTNEPRRALATRALVKLSPQDDGPYPVRVPLLWVDTFGLAGGRGEWCGRWCVTVELRNPFPFPVRGVVEIKVRRGAFEVEGLPMPVELAPGQESSLEFRLTGGSWCPGGDPLVMFLVEWDPGPGRAAGRLLLDAPLHRVRRAEADPIARRLTLLRERPADGEASVVLRRQGSWLLLSIEHSAELHEPQLEAVLDGKRFFGGRGLRMPLPGDFDANADGVSFSCGIRGQRPGAREFVHRRWAGGVPDGFGHGGPGRLVPIGRA